MSRGEEGPRFLPLEYMTGNHLLIAGYNLIFNMEAAGAPY